MDSTGLVLDVIENFRCLERSVERRSCRALLEVDPIPSDARAVSEKQTIAAQRAPHAGRIAAFELESNSHT